MKLLFVANCPLPYQTPVLCALADIVDLHVIYMAGAADGRQRPSDWGGFVDRWGESPTFSHEFVRSVVISVPRFDFRTQLSVGISRRLRALGPDVLLLSSWSPLMVEPLIWAKATGRRSVMWAESTSASGLFRDPITDTFRRGVLSRVDAFIANGDAAAAYLRALGIANDIVVTSRLPSPLRPLLDAANPTSAHDAKTYLFVGRHVPRKRVHDVLAAFARTLHVEPESRLIVVGDGPDEESVQRAVAVIGPRATHVGRLEGEALSRIYGSADVLVVPSEREVWGLVVNEALAHGLYVIASDEVGAAGDLVRPETGFVYPVGRVDELARAMQSAPLASRENRLRAMETMRSVTPERFAADILTAAEIASRLNGHRERAS